MHHNDDHHLIFMMMIIIISGLKFPALFVGPWFSSGQGTRLETPAFHPFRTRPDIGAWQRRCRPGEVFDSANNQRWLFPLFSGNMKWILNQYVLNHDVFLKTLKMFEFLYVSLYHFSLLVLGRIIFQKSDRCCCCAKTGAMRENNVELRKHSSSEAGRTFLEKCRFSNCL